MLNNRRMVSVFGAMVEAAMIAVFPAVLVGALASYALEAGDLGPWFQAVAVYVVCLTVIVTVLVYGVRIQNAAWLINHKEPDIILPVPERIPNLAEEPPLSFDSAVKGLRRQPPKRAVHPSIPDFIDITQAQQWCNDALSGAKLTYPVQVGTHKTFERSEYDDFVKFLMYTGLVTRKTRNIFSTIELTGAGIAWARSVLKIFGPPPQKCVKGSK